MLHSPTERYYQKFLSCFDFHTYKLSRKRLDFICRFSLHTQALLCPGAKVNDRPIGYFFGEDCYDFSLKERAKESIRHSAKQVCLPGTGLGRTANPRRTLTNFKLSRRTATIWTSRNRPDCRKLSYARKIP